MVNHANVHFVLVGVQSPEEPQHPDSLSREAEKISTYPDSWSHRSQGATLPSHTPHLPHKRRFHQQSREDRKPPPSVGWVTAIASPLRPVQSRCPAVPLSGCPGSAPSSGSSAAPRAEWGTSCRAPPHSRCWPPTVPGSTKPPERTKGHMFIEPVQKPKSTGMLSVPREPAARSLQPLHRGAQQSGRGGPQWTLH